MVLRRNNGRQVTKAPADSTLAGALCVWCHESIRSNGGWRSPLETVGGRLVVCGEQCRARPAAALVYSNEDEQAGRVWPWGRPQWPPPAPARPVPARPRARHWFVAP